jgi:DNA-binding NtrC family response regulator
MMHAMGEIGGNLMRNWMKPEKTGHSSNCTTPLSLEDNMEILIVDDERDLLESLRRGLNCLHHKTREVTSADAALKVLQASPSIDLVITDHAMPGMSGMELVEWIRREKADLPVIMMTAFGDKDMVIRILKNRRSGYIEKPFTLKELTEEIKRVTSNGQHCDDQFNAYSRLNKERR